MDLKNVVSAATKSVSCSSFFLLLFTFYLSSFLAQAARNPPPPKEIYHVVDLSSLQPKPYCESPKTGLALLGFENIAMASRKGPCRLPYNPANTISSTQQHFPSAVAKDDGSADPMEYYFSVALGTPKTRYNLFVDTGSDNTWVRCRPYSCSGCKSNGPLFDPSNSRTYVNQTYRSTDQNNNNNVFISSYHDDSAATAHWGCDTLTIQKQHSYVVKNFQFGCAQEIKDTVGDNFGGDDGILGLGRGNLSLPSQAGFHIFGYCIPKRNSRLGYFVFGSEAAKMSSSSLPKFAKLLPGGRTFYSVELKGISVAGKKLDINASDLNNNNESAGAIIDSGTTYTQLPSNALNALLTAFNQTMASIYPAASSQLNSKLGTICYNVDGIDTSAFRVPTITFHFRGIMSEEEIIDVELRPAGILMTTKSNLVCLGFTSSEGFTIIGNHQQRQMGMFFDLQSERIGFGTKNC